MRKLDITQYKVVVLTPEGKKEDVYDVKDALVHLLFHPDLRLNGMALLKQDKIAEKISNATTKVLLEEEEYQKVKGAVDNFKGFTRSEVELVKRVFECPEIKVEEKK